MTTYTAKSPLIAVMRHSEGNRIVKERVPSLVNSPLLHTLYFHEVGLILGTEPGLRGKPEEVAEILRLIESLEPEDLVARRAAAAAVDVPPPSGDYEPESVERGSAVAEYPTTAAAQERFELTLAGPSDGNPFTEVELRAVFTSPSGGTLSVPGFYDANGVYRVRLLVPEAGEWSFSTTSNARSLDGVTGAFTAGEAAAGSKGVVRVAKTFHFAYEDGTPYLPIGTTSYAWTHQGDALEKQTLDTHAAGPFNKMRMCVFPKSYLFNENEPELYPFEGSLLAGFDYDRPNPEFYRHLEHRIAQLDGLGIEADLILFHAYDRWGFSTMSPGQDDRYLKYVVARLASHRNIWWSLANEYDLLFRKTTADWERFAGIVQANDPNGHLLSIHNCHAFYDYSRPWITHSSIQRQDVHKTAEFTREWRDRWQKPVVIDECAYEGNIDQGWGNITGEEMTRRFWEGAIRGGYVGHGETYMHSQDILWWAKGGELHGSSPDRIAFLRRILEETPGGFLEPLPGAWDVPAAGIRHEYELSYFGFNQPTYRNFVMPAGRVYEVDIIDTWNMTIDTLPDTVEGRFRLELPGRQFMAVRLRAVG
ncbi:DUF5605 domain-containing protein [Arthrobacter sp. MMS18-M83]|uniref:DUF5605 domain-containing protein n=1 Tax=Arthrobacter sp. MMS18-M83 TaxID=2996261 RepID=UPI00227AA128|nr:DUF5605 domain-containing protein [Arthrobacter sp. MMS18-M83]WAH98474.1 DUF5605 domain-containing protein [Arthrobacter sp. MMS18-M83]